MRSRACLTAVLLALLPFVASCDESEDTVLVQTCIDFVAGSTSEWVTLEKDEDTSTCTRLVLDFVANADVPDVTAFAADFTYFASQSSIDTVPGVTAGAVWTNPLVSFSVGPAAANGLAPVAVGISQSGSSTDIVTGDALGTIEFTLTSFSAAAGALTFQRAELLDDMTPPMAEPNATLSTDTVLGTVTVQ